MSELTQALLTINRVLEHLPISIRAMAVAEMLFSPEAPSVTGAKSWLDVYTGTKDDVVIGFAGGTYLEQAIPKEFRRYYKLNRQLADLFVRAQRPDGKQGWSIVTGQGPGRAMAGPHYCLREARKEVLAELLECLSKCIGVPSGLKDENPHPFADPEWTVRAQLETLLREILLVLLAKDGLVVYPGWKGSWFETLLAMFINYCAGRSEVGLDPLLLIIVDMPNDPDCGIELSGGSYYEYVLGLMQANAGRLGLSSSKPGSNNGYQLVNVAWPNAPQMIVKTVYASLVARGRMRPEQVPDSISI